MSLKIHFGPYESNSLIRHKPKRLHGILTKLGELGFKIEIIPSKHLERLTVEMKEREIFRCNIKYLKYNMDYEDDELAKKLVEAVQEAHSRFYSDTNVPKYYINRWGMKGVQALALANNPEKLFSSYIELISEIKNEENDCQKETE